MPTNQCYVKANFIIKDLKRKEARNEKANRGSERAAAQDIN